MREITVGALFVAVMFVAAQLALPNPLVPGVPFTLETLAVMLCGLLLPTRVAVLAQCAYLALGAIGLPVFAQFTGGLGILLGPTGGFLLAFPFAAAAAGLFLPHRTPRSQGHSAVSHSAAQAGAGTLYGANERARRPGTAAQRSGAVASRPATAMLALRMGAGAVLAGLVSYAGGWLGFMLFAGLPASSIWGLTSFAPFDLIKAVLAVAIALKARPALMRAMR